MKSHLFALFLLSSLCPATLAQAQSPAQSPFTVFKSPQCGCCGKWVEHLQGEGFAAQSQNRDDMQAVKRELGIPNELQSCHTGVKGNYVFEGHIPADVIRRFLDNPPTGAYGLAVPGMPIGSPGMEMGSRLDRYDVIMLMQDGHHRVFSTIN